MHKLVTLSLFTAVTVFGQATYTIDSAHSAASFSVKHMMVSNVRGQFSKVAGTVVYDEKNLGASKVEATVDVTTVYTREEKRDAHLKSPDFFDVEKFNTMTFKSTSLYREGGKLLMKGDLTIHGVTKPVVFTVDGPSPEVKGMGGMRIGATATATINRKDFGLMWNRALEAGGVVVGDDVQITVDVEAMRK
jgi:polyisoprenoid-binding protein YceI